MIIVLDSTTEEQDTDERDTIQMITEGNLLLFLRRIS